MKNFFLVTLLTLLLSGCSKHINKEEIKQQVYETEKAFELMAHKKGVAEAFYSFADDSAVIKRQNDTLITGKQDIKTFYNREVYKNAEVNWTPDFIEVSESGDLAYTYGRYLWKIWTDKGDTTEFSGVFHTVWKKQKDNSWKYVWD